jgi:hypothetical protein
VALPRDGSGQPPGFAPAFLVHETCEGETTGPAALLKFRIVQKFFRVPDAEIGHRHDVRRNAKDVAKDVVVEDA